MKTRSTKLRLRESDKLKEGKCFGRLMHHWFDRDVTRSGITFLQAMTIKYAALTYLKARQTSYMNKAQV